jgi:hypothetical protein
MTSTLLLSANTARQQTPGQQRCVVYHGRGLVYNLKANNFKGSTTHMGKYISGSPTKESLRQWANYCSQNSQVNANKSNQEPVRQNVSNPDQVRFHALGGRDQNFDADRGGLVVKRGGHKFPEIKAGGCSGEGRIQLSNAQRGRR